MSVLTKLHDWIHEIDDSTLKKSALLHFFASIGLTNILWLVITKQDFHIEEEDLDLSSKQYIESKPEEFLSTLKNFIQTDPINGIMSIPGENFVCVFYTQPNEFGNYTIILAREFNQSKELRDYQAVCEIAYKYLQSVFLRQNLENALTLSMSDHFTFQSITDPKKTKIAEPIDLHPNFIDAVIPHFFYAVAHEHYGPLVISSINDEIYDAKYLITIVNLFTGLNTDMIIQVGHVFSSVPVDQPVRGELINIVFAAPNDNARGKYEIHALSILIPQEFRNLSQSIMSSIKLQLFNASEQMRLQIDQYKWELAIPEFKLAKNDEILIQDILKAIREAVASSFALLMDPQDVSNWQ